MDVYLFIQTEPGLATTVMSSLVESKAVTRAAAVTGPFDIFARIDGVDFNELTTRLVDRVQRTPGVLRTETSGGLPVSAVAAISPVPLMPLRTTLTGPQALVFARLQPGLGIAALKTIAGARSVASIAVLTGEYDAVMQVGGSSLEAIARKVMREIQSVPGVVSTTTSLVAAITPLASSARKRTRKAPRRSAAKKRSRTTRRPRR